MRIQEEYFNDILFSLRRKKFLYLLIGNICFLISKDICEIFSKTIQKYLVFKDFGYLRVYIYTFLQLSRTYTLEYTF